MFPLPIYQAVIGNLLKTRLCGRLKLIARNSSVNGEMAKSHRDALALDSFVGFGSFSLSGVLLGSMGMDIRWTSKKAPYVAATFAVLLGCACMAAGLKLRKGQRLEPS